MSQEYLSCEVCSSNNLYEVLDLGHQPPSDAFLSEEKLNGPETFYPLKLYFCEDCKLVQLSYAVDPKLLFTEDYVYTSSSNKPLLKHMESLVENVVREFGLGEGSLVIDIASNDGALLKIFKEHGVKILGVDPASIAEISIKEGIPTLKDFFNEDLANSILRDYGKSRFITGLSLIPHAKELSSIIKGVRLLLDERGVFLTESHYLRDMIEKLQYDAIYHEHLRYYSVTSLVNLFNKFDMDVFHAERIPTHGGSIRILTCKKGDHPIRESVQKLLLEEETSGLNSHKNFDNFRQRVRNNEIKLNNIIHEIKSRGERIVGIGAPAKGTTLLNFCKIHPGKLDYLVETNELKIGKYSPGMHLKIFHEDKLFEDQPEYALILPWNIKEYLIPKLKERGFKGKIIIPNPEPEIVDYDGTNSQKDEQELGFGIKKIKPAHEDGRGKIYDVIDGEEFMHAGIATYNPGAIRANHYHKKTEQIDYVLKGKFKYKTKDLSKRGSPVRETILEKGDFVINKPFEWHSHEALEESELLFFTKKARKAGGYEDDVFRVSLEEIENFELGENK